MRLFIAWTIAQSAKAEIERIAAPLRSTLPRASWVRPDAWHLTVAFLGEHEETIIGPLNNELGAVVSTIVPFDAVLHGAGFFPPNRRPRVAWVGINPDDRWREVGSAVHAALSRAHVPFDDKEFHPHLTLARLREPWLRSDAERFVHAFAGCDIAGGRVDHVSLYSSELLPDGAKHTEVARFAFHGTKSEE